MRAVYPTRPIIPVVTMGEQKKLTGSLYNFLHLYVTSPQRHNKFLRHQLHNWTNVRT